MEILKPFVILGFLNDVADQVWYMKGISMSKQWVGITLCFLGREREHPKKLSRCSGWEQEIQKTIVMVGMGMGNTRNHSGQEILKSLKSI